VQSVVWRRVEPGPQVGVEAGAVVMEAAAAVVVARVVGVWVGVGDGTVEAETETAAAARRRWRIVAAILIVFRLLFLGC
jgi:hypothetical protein